MSTETNNTLNDWEPSVKAQETIPVPVSEGETHVTQYSVIIKRNDRAYRVLSAINTTTLVVGVLLIAGIFGMVAYTLFTTMNTNEVLEVLRSQGH